MSVFCPRCNATSTITGGGGTSVATGWKRTRSCRNGHIFDTIERTMTHEVLSNVVIEGFNGREEPFTPDRLLADLSTTAGDVLTKGQRRTVLHRAEVSLAASIPDRRSKRRGRPSSEPVAIPVQDVQAIVAEALKHEGASRENDRDAGRQFRQAHLLYVLARGQGARLRTGRDVLAWLHETYDIGSAAEARSAHEEAHFRDVREDRWHPLLRDAAPQPSMVHNVSQTQDRELRTAFSRDRLERRIRRAFAGRNEWSFQAHYVAQWVLWSLVGQDIVRSADLLALTTQCIRRVDPVAYIRWVTVVKDLDVGDVWIEALGLVRWPSPKLIFDVEAAADPRRTDQLHPQFEQIVHLVADTEVS